MSELYIYWNKLFMHTKDNVLSKPVALKKI